VGVDQGSQDFAEFYEQSRDGCFRVVLTSVGDRHQAEELVSEAFAKAWASWRKVSRHPAPQAWVVRTALNTHVSWWRRRRREVSWDGYDPADGSGLGSGVGTGSGTGSGFSPGTSGDVSDSALDARIMAALRALPPRQREVVALRVFLDLDTRATAEALGIAQGTVQAHLHRALGALRADLASFTEQETRA
jgi:RNA polymerase sigma factor (sigma-70 family)